MEEITQYSHKSPDDLIQILIKRDQTIVDLKKETEELKKAIEELKHPVRKDSTNSSIPTDIRN
jgi:hypothetical protein